LCFTVTCSESLYLLRKSSLGNVFEAAGGEINISVLTVALCNWSVKVIYGRSLTSFVK